MSAGWPLVALADACTLITDGTHRSPPNKPTGDFKYVTAKNIRKWGLDLSDITYVDAETHEGIYKRCPVEKGDVLYIKDGVTTGLAAVNTLEEPFSMLSSVALLKPRRDVLFPPFLKHWLNSPETFANMTSQMTGSAIKRLVLKQISAASIPLPPLAEQKRIADKLDRLLAAVDTCKARLDAIPAILKRFRQSVLAAATSGELTEEWNEQSSRRLLRFDEDELTIPDSWTDVPLAELIEPDRPLCYGVVQPGLEAEGGVPLIRVQDLENGTVRIKDLRTISPMLDHEFRRSRVRANDLLVSLVGTIGRIAVVPEDLNANIARAIARVACRPGVLPQWVQIWMSTEVVQWWLLRSAREVARKTLNLSELATTRVALPSLDEQRDIVARVGCLFDAVDESLRKVIAAQSRLELLTQALLSKAFHGELAD